MMEHLQQVRSPGIRVQLTLWYTAVFAILILMFSLIFYTTIQAFLASGVDSALQLRAQQIAAGDVRHAVSAGDAPRLCALARADRPQQDQVERSIWQ